MLQDDTLLGGLYIIHLGNGYYYGGRTICFKTRWDEHLSNLQSRKASSYMQNVYNKYGRFEPAILLILPREEQEAAEQKWLDEHFRKPGCVNMSPHAKGGCFGHTPEARAKMRATRASRPDLAQKSREQLRKNFCWKGVKKSPEQIRKMAEKLRGRKQSEESIAKRAESNKGQKRSPESRARQSEAAKIRVQKYPIRFSEVTRALISQQQTGRIWLNNGSMNTNVRPENVQSYLDQGWLLGRFGSCSPEHRALISESSKDRIWLTDGNKNLFVKPDQVEALQLEGWTLGRSNVKPVAQEARDRSGAKRHGRVWATDGTDNLLVSPEEIPEGWYIGLTKKLPVFTDEAKAALSAKRRNKRWIHDMESGRNTCVDETDLSRYLEEGWALGRMASAGAN